MFFMNIAILGGSFDPPHNGHVVLANEILKKFSFQPQGLTPKYFEKILLVPCFAHAFGKKLSSPQDRSAMTKLLESENVRASDIEIQKTGISYSIKTLHDLQKQFPTDHLYWVIGSDQLAEFHTWEGWKEIIKDFGLIVAQRGNEKHFQQNVEESLQELKSENTLFLLAPNDIPNISSTEIREKVKRNESIHNLVPKSVEEYIVKHSLYE